MEKCALDGINDVNNMSGKTIVLDRKLEHDNSSFGAVTQGRWLLSLNHLGVGVSTAVFECLCDM